MYKLNGLLLEIEKELSGEPSEENALNALLLVREAQNLLSKAPVMLSLPSDGEIDNFDLSKYPHMTQEGAILIRWGMTVMRDEIRNRVEGNGA